MKGRWSKETCTTGLSFINAAAPSGVFVATPQHLPAYLSRRRSTFRHGGGGSRVKIAAYD
ncbi:hypothetical protein ART_0124 [Arthrobacter sp. PAMC 25486]|nr:hypothetical protein ART_0124 [Arthrobacter sp. PAMC 25486]